MKKTKEKIKNKKTNNIFNSLGYILFIILLILLAVSCYIKTNFSTATFEQLYVTFIESEGFSFESIKYGLIYSIIFIIIALLILVGIPKMFNKLIKNNYEFSLKFKNKIIFKLTLPVKLGKAYYLCLSLIFIILSIYNIGLKDYVISKLSVSTLYEEYYINPRKTKITFPENKKNLIYIYLESMESSYAEAKDENGNHISYIKELETLANENISFSNTDGLGGAYTLSNTTWTIAAMVAHTAGTPLTTSIDGNSYSGYSSFLPGVYSLGEVLEDNGYKNYLMLGSDANFGGRLDYFTIHGNYTIYDYIYAKENGWIEEDYYTWWGFEDKKLFEFAKKELLEISKKEEPFNFTILTVDTHFQDGYLDEDCETPYNEQYANVVSCSSKRVNEFVNWLKKQKFYKDTVIVIVGDHLTMQYGDFLDSIDSNRTVYNAFINTNINTYNTKNREFSTLDFYPTTLAALGAKIDGNRLGLGTNLFSDKKTLIEELGKDYLNVEIPKRSEYYNTELLQSTYFEIMS